MEKQQFPTYTSPQIDEIVLETSCSLMYDSNNKGTEGMGDVPGLYDDWNIC